MTRSKEQQRRREMHTLIAMSAMVTAWEYMERHRITVEEIDEHVKHFMQKTYGECEICKALLR